MSDNSIKEFGRSLAKLWAATVVLQKEISSEAVVQTGRETAHDPAEVHVSTAPLALAEPPAMRLQVVMVPSLFLCSVVQPRLRQSSASSISVVISQGCHFSEVPKRLIYIRATSYSDMERRSRKIECQILQPISCGTITASTPTSSNISAGAQKVAANLTVVGCIARHFQITCEGGASCRNSGKTDFFTDTRGGQNIRVLSSRRLFRQWDTDYLGFPGTI